MIDKLQQKRKTCRDVNLAKRFAVFLGLKESILYEKIVFSPAVQCTCVVINLEKKQYFPKSCSISEVFSSKNSTKYCKKEHLASLDMYFLVKINTFWILLSS